MANFTPDSTNFNTTSVAEIQPTDRVLASFVNGYFQQFLDNDASLKALDTRNKHTVTVTLAANAWQGTTVPYTQAVTVTGVTASDAPEYSPVTPSSVTTWSALKAYRKQCAYLEKFVTGTNTVTFYAMNLPTMNIQIELKGV